jgi:hypothetical protein
MNDEMNDLALALDAAGCEAAELARQLVNVES